MIRRAWRWFVTRPDADAKAGDIIKWWEVRRLAYNGIVGIGVVISFVLFFVFIIASGTLGPGEDAVEPLGLTAMAIAGPIIANICYTGGWILELLLRAIGLRRRRVGAVLLIAGTVFSLLVVGAPAIYWGAYCLVHM